jgi:hypothetical protein
MYLSWLLHLRPLPWRQQWRKPAGQVVPGQVVPGQVVPGQVVPEQVVQAQAQPEPQRQRLHTVEWVPLVQTRRTRRTPHWAHQIRPQAPQRTPIPPWVVARQERRLGPRPQALIVSSAAFASAYPPTVRDTPPAAATPAAGFLRRPCARSGARSGFPAAGSTCA